MHYRIWSWRCCPCGHRTKNAKARSNVIVLFFLSNLWLLAHSIIMSASLSIRRFKIVVIGAGGVGMLLIYVFSVMFIDACS